MANWIHLAVASGLCAAINGLFAKLTTTTLTSSIATAIVGGESRAVEVVVRGGFFVLNLVFNAIMWGLFTAALAKGSSATTVSVINTSANFMATALFGWWVFAEALPGTWWVGAAMLVAGSVIISRRDTEEKAKSAEYRAVETAEREEVTGEEEGEEEGEKEGEEEGEKEGEEEGEGEGEGNELRREVTIVRERKN